MYLFIHLLFSYSCSSLRAVVFSVQSNYISIMIEARYTWIVFSIQAKKENDDITKLVRRAAVFPLVPRNEVEDVWFNALQDIGDAAHNVPDTTTFTDYVTEHWVESHIFLWNHYLTEGSSTTNHLEGWNNKIKKKVRHAYTNIYEIIDLLQTTQAMTDV